ncbi:MAG: rhomboid family intramembrane serine protease [Luteolibacter sp.]
MSQFVEFRYLLRRQGVVLGLIVFLIAILFLQSITSYDFTLRFSAIPDEVVAAWQALRFGNLSAEAGAEFLTLFTAGLLHGDFGHLSGNLLFLWIFAAIACELLGARWVIPIFAFTAITGSICHVALNLTDDAPCLGASGAVMGFEGLYLAMVVRWHLPDPHIWPMASPVAPGRLALIGILGLIFDFNGYLSGIEGVAYGAHLGGFIGGLFLGGFVVPMPRVALPR